ncbi:hypothetical protein ACGFI9_12280 [Micromonospora sp. NPDC048930]|uniref:hypothetical protein n=1 Tax=Micromonospora sp. NPDC048930 TaxID=3364261 RepID=UPI0037197018
MTNVQATAEVASSAGGTPAGNTEHHVVPGWAGPAGEVRCTCGAVYAGGSVRESSRLLGNHIARRARAAAEAAGPDQVVSPIDRALADSAGQSALVRIARTNMLREISRLCYAVDRAALPAPRAVRFDSRTHAAQLDFDTEGEAIAWAARLGAEPGALRSARHFAMVGATGYHAIVDWRGVRVDLVSVVPVAAPAAADQAPAVGEHYQTGGWTGGPGECGVRCACGTVFDGFDSPGEAVDLLNHHIVRETDPAARKQAEAVSA